MNRRRTYRSVFWFKTWRLARDPFLADQFKDVIAGKGDVFKRFDLVSRCSVSLSNEAILPRSRISIARKPPLSALCRLLQLNTEFFSESPYPRRARIARHISPKQLLVQINLTPGERHCSGSRCRLQSLCWDRRSQTRFSLNRAPPHLTASFGGSIPYNPAWEHEVSTT